MRMPWKQPFPPTSRNWRRWKALVDYADEETRQKVRSCAWNTVKAYMDSDEVSSQMPLGVEVGISATIPGLPVPVRGVIDLVQHDLTAVNYKSAATKPDAGHATFTGHLPDDDQRSDGRHTSVAGSDLPGQNEDASGDPGEDSLSKRTAQATRRRSVQDRLRRHHHRAFPPPTRDAMLLVPV